MYCNEWMMYMKKFTLNLKNTALKPDKLLHATCRLTYSAVQHTVNYVQLSSRIELVAPYLQSINLPVQCSGKYAQIVQSQLLLSIKTFCNVSFAFIPGTFGDGILRIWFTKVLNSIIANSNLYYVCKVNVTSDIARWVLWVCLENLNFKYEWAYLAVRILEIDNDYFPS